MSQLKLFIRRDDVIHFLKQTTDNELHQIIPECMTYPNISEHNTDLVFGKSMIYDGSKRSFKTAVESFESDNVVLNSSEIEWIQIIMKHCAVFFDEYKIQLFSGVMICKQEIPLIFISKHSDSNDLNDLNDLNDRGRYVRISYDALRLIISDEKRNETLLEYGVQHVDVCKRFSQKNQHVDTSINTWNTWNIFTNIVTIGMLVGSGYALYGMAIDQLSKYE